MQDERWLRYFPHRSLTARPDLHRGQAEYFSLFLYRMDGPTWLERKGRR
jgi:hypothetical protein